MVIFERIETVWGESFSRRPYNSTKVLEGPSGSAEKNPLVGLNLVKGRNTRGEEGGDSETGGRKEIEVAMDSREGRRSVHADKG